MPTRRPEKQDVDRDGRRETRRVGRRKDGTYAPGKRPLVSPPKKTCR